MLEDKANLKKIISALEKAGMTNEAATVNKDGKLIGKEIDGVVRYQIGDYMLTPGELNKFINTGVLPSLPKAPESFSNTANRINPNPRSISNIRALSP